MALEGGCNLDCRLGQGEGLLRLENGAWLSATLGREVVENAVVVLVHLPGLLRGNSRGLIFGTWGMWEEESAPSDRERARRSADDLATTAVPPERNSERNAITVVAGMLPEISTEVLGG